MSQQNIKVFISYAWESETFRDAIWDLAFWVTINSKIAGTPVDVVTDHLFSIKPPETGWYRWIRNSIAEANIVIVVCTPSYLRYFDGDDEDRNKGGYGVTYEATIITKHMYVQKGKNMKFYPILPDGGEITNIPDILVSYYNGQTFTSGNEKILELIIGENPKHIIPKPLENDSELTSENIIALEKEISSELKEAAENDAKNMSYAIQNLVRSYLSLTNLEKIIVIKDIVDDFEVYLKLSPFEKDKLFLKEIDGEKKMNLLWSALNKVKPFENNQNPFE